MPCSSSSVRFATRSRKYLSCVTIKSALEYFSKCFSSQSTVSLSIWFVGSSRISKSTGAISAAANATRFFCPPESVSTVCPKSEMPSLVRIVFASLSKDHASALSIFSASSAARFTSLSSSGVFASAAIVSSYSRTRASCGFSPRNTCCSTVVPSTKTGLWER